MIRPIKVLLQTTIEHIEADWHIGRFSMLADHLRSLTAGDGHPLADVTARNRTMPGKPDPVLSTLDRSPFDELWLFAVDAGDGLHPDDCAGIARFRQRGGGLLVTRDHMDLGCSVCTLGGVGAAHQFHTHNRDASMPAPAPDDRETPAILWPNFHSGSNGDCQRIESVAPIHPVLADPSEPGGALRYLPAHPHEGSVVAPPQDPSARVIATGTSKASGARFNIAVVFEPSSDAGPALAQSTFHHFADYNLDVSRGCPGFVTEAPGDGMSRTPLALRSVHLYVRNAALWLAQRAMT